MSGFIRYGFQLSDSLVNYPARKGLREGEREFRKDVDIQQNHIYSSYLLVGLAGD